MFTGIIQAVGRVRELKAQRGGARLGVTAPAAILRRLKMGDSIAVNGCCLTVVGKRGGAFAADLSGETLRRTALGGYRAGTRVNLEPALRMGDPLGGHMVQGHVEGTGRMIELRTLPGSAGWWLRIAMPPELRRLVVPKGSLAVDGISLTVAALEGDEAAFAIIPHTWKNTHLRRLEPGAAVNLETDPIARQVEQILAARGGSAALSEAQLRKQGF